MATTQNYSWPSSSDVVITGIGNPTGQPVPADAVYVAGENPSGSLMGLQTDSAGNLFVSLAADTAELNVNLNQVGGAAITLGQKVSASSLPVVLASDQSAIPVSQSGTWNINNISGTISLPTGAATSANQTTANTSLSTIASNQTNASQKTQIVDGSGNVIASTSNALNVNISSSSPTLSQNLTQVGGASITLGQKTSAASFPVVIASDQSAVPVSQSGTWNITNITGAVSLPTGAATSANQTTANTTLSTIATNTTGLNNTITTTGSTAPTEALQIGVKNGTSLVAITQGSATSANSLPVVIASDQAAVFVKAGQGVMTDSSGSTSGTPNTSTQIFASNASRKYLLIQNLSSTATIFINFTGSATSAAGSYYLGPLGTIVQESTFVSTEAVNVASATASVPFTAKQG